MLETINRMKILSSMKTHKGDGNQSPIDELAYFIPAHADAAFPHAIVDAGRGKKTETIRVQIVLISCVKRTNVQFISGLWSKLTSTSYKIK